MKYGIIFFYFLLVLLIFESCSKDSKIIQLTPEIQIKIDFKIPQDMDASLSFVGDDYIFFWDKEKAIYQYKISTKSLDSITKVPIKYKWFLPKGDSIFLYTNNSIDLFYKGTINHFYKLDNSYNFFRSVLATPKIYSNCIVSNIRINIKKIRTYFTNEFMNSQRLLLLNRDGSEIAKKVTYPSNFYPYNDTIFNYNRLEHNLSYDVFNNDIFTLYPFSNLIIRYANESNEKEIIPIATDLDCCQTKHEAKSTEMKQNVAKFFYSVSMYNQIKVINDDLFFINYTYGPKWKKGNISKTEKKSLLLLLNKSGVVEEYKISNQENYYFEFGDKYFLIRQKDNENKSIFSLYKYPVF